MSRVNIDWNAIRPLNGARAKGFEELCAQLARAESPAGSRFERKGTPDGGVECYAVLSSGDEWGWQAKYFDTLDDSQWGQLDKSVATALDKHPQLVRYIVCIPLDRPDARVDNRKSAKDRWDDHTQKWAGWASARNMSVEFVYWGSSELLERLFRSEHVGRVRFWFDTRGFDGAWFTARLDEALKTAGPRYTPEIHVNLPIFAELDAFGRTERFFDHVKAYARRVREKLRAFVAYEPKAAEPALGSATSILSSQVQAILTELGTIESQPVGVLPFAQIAERAAAAETAAENVERLLVEREREYDEKQAATSGSPSPSSYRNNPFRDRRFRLGALCAELRSTLEALTRAEAVAGPALMLLRGDAGTGKTHLLCDVARQRVATNRPTVLLMGQRFVSADAPWAQALQQLDLPGLSAEEFTGALEAAAQASCCRALVIIDALNEGSGRIIWPSHLAAFLAHLERSPWIGVVLSVRSSYEQIIIPEEVRAHAVPVTHEGFSEHEYDATRTFFVHYGLELPSTPLLAPEFRNPLFLKTLCRGLNAKGERRLPRGFHGITAIFELHLAAINERLAAVLGFNPKTPLVRQALEAFSDALIDFGQRWLTLAKAEEVVTALLPGREFERSLYRGLVVEGVLVEEAAWRPDDAREEVVFIAYERFADHLAAKTLLDKHLDLADPASAFSAGCPLAFLCDKYTYVAPGILEAMCIQIPERVGQELISLAPQIVDRLGIGDAFRRSLVWRAITAFSDDTRTALNTLTQSDHDCDDTLDALLTVAMIPGHPLNATFLDRRLRKDTMAERDCWWSVYLHQAWGSHGAVDRLVDWASSVVPMMTVEEETLELCATSLSWMLTTSNRFLRDRATKALVSLLTGRLDAVVQLVERFADVDDLYVVERIYAVAHGTAMRSHDPAAVGALAACVYARVFAGGAPPTHILLRDYARGVIERAIHLASPVEVDFDLCRPPYKSQWPAIPSEADIKPLLPDWSRGSYDSRELEWARNCIGASVMSGDFARYVIGTNSDSSHWLSVKLMQPMWKPPERPEALLSALVDEFSAAERQALQAFAAAEKAFDQALSSFMSAWFETHDEDSSSRGTALGENDALMNEIEKILPPEIGELQEESKRARLVLETAITDEHARRLEEIRALKEIDSEARRPPRFDLRQIQRYILWRVFDLGWTTERFGYFDRFIIRVDGREASKAERMGKKYQWITYHLLISDHDCTG